MAKHVGLGPLLEVEILKECEAHLEVEMCKAHYVLTTLESCDVEEVHAVVARNTFGSEKCSKLSAEENFWKVRCRKSVRRCGANHIFEVKTYITPHVRATYDVPMWS